MISQINPYNIIASHLDSFQNLKTKKRDWLGIIFMFITPTVISIMLVYFKKGKYTINTSDILTFVSFTGGFLFNLLALIYSILEKVKNDATNDIIKITYSKEVHSNISFGILIAIICSIFLVLYTFETPFHYYENKIVIISLFAIYYFLFVFILNLLLILKKIFIILDNQ